MAAHIPFVNTKKDCQILKKYYKNSHIVRVSLESITKIRSSIPNNIPLWLDPAIDGCEHHLKNKNKPLPPYITNLEGSTIFQNTSLIKKPNTEKVQSFVTSIMDQCFTFNPNWISVPLLPLTSDNSRNKINSALADATYKWKVKTKFKGDLILPLIFTNHKQLNNRTSWRPRLDSAAKWYEKSGAKGIWIVDASLSDQKPTATFTNRLRSLVELHHYLKQLFPKEKIIAGPYWAMNLILWAKSLCNYPAINLGTSYQYYLPGDEFRRKGKSRIAVPPLKRWVVFSPELRDWLDKVLNVLDSQDAAFKHMAIVKDEVEREFIELGQRYDPYNEELNREQIVDFYKQWLDRIEKTPQVGQQLVLYQDFSSAFVLGKQLPDLPSSETPRRPEKVAEYLMLSCL